MLLVNNSGSGEQSLIFVVTGSTLNWGANNINANPEAKIRLVNKYTSAYKELVDDHGYRKLTFP